LPQEDLMVEPVVHDGEVVGELQLVPDAAWRALPYITNTLKYEEPAKSSAQGTTYQVRVTAQRPQPSAGILAALAALDRRKLLLLLVEAGGGRRLIGSLEEYVLLLTNTEGQNPATKSGVELRFEGEMSRRAPYYSGAVPVLSGVIPPAPTGVGFVEIRDRADRLMARVKVGTIVTITSGFRVSLSFK
jgi:hypothetical protein